MGPRWLDWTVIITGCILINVISPSKSHPPLHLLVTQRALKITIAALATKKNIAIEKKRLDKKNSPFYARSTSLSLTSGINLLQCTHILLASLQASRSPSVPPLRSMKEVAVPLLCTTIAGSNTLSSIYPLTNL